MVITRIHVRGTERLVKEAVITERGLSGKDDLVSVISKATLAYCRKEGREGLCTSKFRADLIVDELIPMKPGQKILCGTAEFEISSRRKLCHGGCSLEPENCLLNDGVLFLRVSRPGVIKTGDLLIVIN